MRRRWWIPPVPACRFYYESPAEFTPKLAVTVDVLQAVLDERVFLTVREELGNTYHAGAYLDIVMTPDVTVEFGVHIHG